MLEYADRSFDRLSSTELKPACQAQDEALREERRVRALGKELFESWPEDRRRQFDSRLEARLASQIDEDTGTPVLPPDSYLRALTLKHHRAAGLSKLVRLQETPAARAEAP